MTGSNSKRRRSDRWVDGRGEFALFRSSPAPAVVVRFYRWNGGFVILVTTGSPPWSLQALLSGRASLSVSPGRWIRCAVRPLSPAELSSLPEIMQGFHDRYGADLVREHLASPDSILFLSEDGPEDPEDPWTPIRREFDAAAPPYFEHNRTDAVDRYAKGRSLQRLRETFQGRDPLLELGPGTGIETIPLLKEGHRILAVDLSPGMLSALRTRAAEHKVGGALETRTGPLGGLEGLLSDVPSGHFRGAFSTFGAFNLEPDLSPVPRALARVMAPGSPLFLAVLNRHGLPPLVFSALQGRVGEIRARFLDPVPAEGIGYPLALHPFTRRELKRRLTPWFTL